ncbi:MAG: SDR family oxidoreductase [Alphaproteobacteria bacterium]|nr:SDR family oxidoreductase [Alphaproteobacteria bacterium]
MIKRRTALTSAFALSFMAHCGNVTINKAFAQEGRAAPPPVLPSMKGETVLVTGATGRVGKQVVEMLLAQGVKVRGTARDAAKAKAEQPNVEWIQAEFKQLESLKGLANGVDRIVLTTGANTFRDPTNSPEMVEFRAPAAIVDEAKAAGVKQIVLVSSVSVTTSDPTAAQGIGAVMRWKNELEKRIRKSGSPYTVVRPVGLWDKPRGENPIALIPGDVQVPSMVTRGDVALVVVDALANPDARGKSFTVFNVTHPDLTGWKSAFAKLPRD